MNRIKDAGKLDQTEDQLQARVWRRVWQEYPFLRRRIWHVANQGSGSVVRGQELKAMGLLEGVWDLHLFYHRTYVVWEAKVGTNQLTKDRVDRKGKRHWGQKEWGEIMTGEGARTFVFRTEEEFFIQLRGLLDEIDPGWRDRVVGEDVKNKT